ncbi:MAG: DUF2867 domain-containing protein [Bacteroidota bacterium]|nr:DUF2867 domain-containing protein [Bacteroidota bacterium]
MKKIQLRITKTALPINSLIEKSFPRFDYADAYVCKFGTNKQITTDDLVFAFFDSGPKWVVTLFYLRNSIAKVFGLKAPGTDDLDALRKNIKVEKGNGLGLFKVLDKTADEVLLGEDDKHLNFRLSFFLCNDELTKTNTFILSTTVLMNNRLGKLYFLFVKPFHNIIVPTIMKEIVNKTV